MTARRTNPNLLEEARHLADDSYAYGAFILSRAVGNELRASLEPVCCQPRCTQYGHMKIVAAWFGPIIDAAAPKNPARRHIIIEDAADLAFAPAAT
jgi:hypothetical protein